jgi:DNA-binding CsgD family transcriptional regulator
MHVRPIFPGCLALNHSNDAAFDRGRPALCIGADREHKLATGCYDQNIAKFLRSRKAFFGDRSMHAFTSPQLQNAISLRTEFTNDSSSARWFEADNSAHFITNNSGKVIHANAAARTLLDDGQLWIDREGCLAWSRRCKPVRDLLSRAMQTAGVQRCLCESTPDQWIGISATMINESCPDRFLINVREIRPTMDGDMQLIIDHFGISRSEAPVLYGLAKAVCPKEISRSLGLSVFTIRSHIRSIYAKLKVKNAAEAQKSIHAFVSVISCL